MTGYIVPSAFAASDSSSNSWVLLADPHISGRLGKIFLGSCMAANLERVTDEIIERDAGASGILVNGDCAHLRGKKDDYHNLASLIRPLSEGRRDVHLLMGNHDDREVFAGTFADHLSGNDAVPEKHVGMIASPQANWFLLDSLEPGRWTRGRIGRDQLRWLSAMLDQFPDKPAIVLAHHHLHINTEGEDSRRPSGGLLDSGALYDLIRGKRQVKAYIHGHTHRWRIRQSPDGLYLINLPSTAYAFHRWWPTGWVDCRLREDGMKVELRALDHAHPDHGVPRFLKWRG